MTVKAKTRAFLQKSEKCTQHWSSVGWSLFLLNDVWPFLSRNFPQYNSKTKHIYLRGYITSVQCLRSHVKRCPNTTGHSKAHCCATLFLRIIKVGVACEGVCACLCFGKTLPNGTKVRNFCSHGSMYKNVGTFQVPKMVLVVVFTIRQTESAKKGHD